MEFLNGIPYRRAAPTLEALLDVRLSVGTLEAAQTRIAERLKSAADCIYEFLRSPNVLCADETRARGRRAKIIGFTSYATEKPLITFCGKKEGNRESKTA
jgi:hypothetical protein